MSRIVIDEGRCKGCALCTHVCPHNLVHMATHFNARDTSPPNSSTPRATCTACANCATMCPDLAITVYRTRRSARTQRGTHTQKGAAPPPGRRPVQSIERDTPTMAKVLMKGNEALAEAAVRAGCQAYYGYPITPQTELLEYMAARMPALGRAFVQAESELAAINMVYGAACAGVRTMTSTSSPGFSLMQEALSYIAGSEVPAVVVNVMRGGPGWATSSPPKGTTFRWSREAGTGTTRRSCWPRRPSKKPSTTWRWPLTWPTSIAPIAMVIADGMIGQMMEPVELPPMRELDRPEPDYALRGCEGREKRIITSLYLGGPNLEAVNDRLQARLREIVAHEQRWETVSCDDAEVVVVAFGTAARIAKTAVRHARERGLRAGLFRPVTVFPFPYQPLEEVAAGKKLLVFELNAGQMLEDVRLAVHDSVPIRFLGRTGGVVPLPEDVLEEIMLPARCDRVTDDHNGRQTETAAILRTS